MPPSTRKRWRYGVGAPVVSLKQGRESFVALLRLNQVTNLISFALVHQASWDTLRIAVGGLPVLINLAMRQRDSLPTNPARGGCDFRERHILTIDCEMCSTW